MPSYLPPTMSLADMRSMCRLTCPDGDQWPDTSLDSWIIEAIRMYSAQFPRMRRHDLALETGVQSYDLPNDCRLVIQVEYPTGQTPRVFLTEVNLAASLFANADYVYALEAIATDDLNEGPVLLTFAQTVATGETASVTYHGAWEVPAVSDDGATITIPTQHYEIIQSFVEYRGHWMLEANAAVNPDNVSLTLSELGANARRAWNRYKEVTVRLQTPPAIRAATPVWKYT